MGLVLDKNNGSATAFDKVAQVTEWLNENYEVRINFYDTSQSRIISKNKEYNFAIKIDDIYLHMVSDCIKCSEPLLRKIITNPNYMRHYNPIEEYFNKVRGTYKGYSHIDLLCAHIKVVDYGDKPENYYNIRAIKLLKKWLVAAAACSSGVLRNDVTLIFAQEQEGTGKTTLAQFLCPPELSDMIVKSSNDPKLFHGEREYATDFFILYDEMVGLYGTTKAETFKSTISASDIKIKDKNDPFPVTKKRIGNAIGTTNLKTGNYRGFLTRQLGTRRFAVIHIEELKDFIGKLDIDQIWAEALMLCESQNFEYKWTQDDFKDFREVNPRYMIETPATVLISQSYRVPADNEEGEWMQAIDIIRDLKERKLLKSDFVKDITPERVGEALMSLGFHRKAKRIKNLDTPRYCYHVISL